MSKQYVVDDKGNKTGALLSIDEYDQLIEDLEDLAVIAERVDEPRESLDVVKERLKSKWRAD